VTDGRVAARQAGDCCGARRLARNRALPPSPCGRGWREGSKRTPPPNPLPQGEGAGLLSAPLDDSSFAAIRETWLHAKVAVFPNQQFTEAVLTRFGQRFGELEIHVRSTYHSRHHPVVMIVSTKKEGGFR
jgi:Taurine catabolism dioxygenase TauD, TfdA family